MAHPDLTWFCGACGYKRNKTHTCPPDPQATIDGLVDALLKNAPSSAVREEVKHLASMLRQHRPDALTVSAGTLRWLLSAFSYLEVATKRLTPYTAAALNAPRPAPTAAPKVPPPRPCIWCNGVGGNQCPECYAPDTEGGA